MYSTWITWNAVCNASNWKPTTHSGTNTSLTHGRFPKFTYNDECRAIKAKTQRLEKIYRQTRTDGAKTAWRAQFSLQRSTFQRLHTEYWSAVIRECPDSRTLWRKFDSLLQPSRQTAADDIAKFFSSKVDAIRLTTATVPQPVITTRQFELRHLG